MRLISSAPILTTALTAESAHSQTAIEDDRVSYGSIPSSEFTGLMHRDILIRKKRVVDHDVTDLKIGTNLDQPDSATNSKG